jgi:hypothetical protein
MVRGFDIPFENPHPLFSVIMVAGNPSGNRFQPEENFCIILYMSI